MRFAIRGLLLACHPLPTLAVTLLSTGLAVEAGTGLGRAGLVLLSVLAGQLSIGWSNDRIDAARDAESARPDKPVARGVVAARTVALAAGIALVIAVTLPFALGPRAAVAAMVIVVCGWAYNLGLKATALSWVPYALAFGTLPGVATLALTPPRWPPAWAVAAGALLGVAAHIANVLPDLVDDLSTGVRGLPHRLGARTSALVFSGLLTVAAAVVLLGPSGAGPARWLALIITVAIAIAVTRLRSDSRWFFPAALAIVGIDLVAFALAGSALS